MVDDRSASEKPKTAPNASRHPATGAPRSERGSVVLEASDIAVYAKGRGIVEGVSFELRAGEVVALIGPNGAGKTTLLEALVGLRLRQAGTVRFRAEPIARFAELARTFSFMPDEVSHPPELDVREVIDPVIAAQGRRQDLVRTLADRLLIGPLRGRPTAVLSRGERKRVALFVALALDRPVVVLDEPFSAFDPVQMQDVIPAVRLLASEGAAVLTSIHHMSDAERASDRLLLIAEGRRVAFGSPAELREQSGASTLEQAFIRFLEERRIVSA